MVDTYDETFTKSALVIDNVPIGIPFLSIFTFDF